MKFGLLKNIQHIWRHFLFFFLYYLIVSEKKSPPIFFLCEICGLRNPPYCRLFLGSDYLWPYGPERPRRLFTEVVPYLTAMCKAERAREARGQGAALCNLPPLKSKGVEGPQLFFVVS